MKEKCLYSRNVLRDIKVKQKMQVLVSKFTICHAVNMRFGHGGKGSKKLK